MNFVKNLLINIRVAGWASNPDDKVFGKVNLAAEASPPDERNAYISAFVR